MKSLNKLIIASITALISLSSHANLITNGSFEDNTLKAGTWSLYNSSSVNGWEAQRIEIWNNLFGTPAYEGNNLTELNSISIKNGSHILSQTFNTSINTAYTIDFAYRARSNSNESFKVDIFSTNGNVFSQVFEDHTKSQWSTFSSAFTANGAESVIQFTSIAPSSSVGNLIDDVVVEAKSVSAPTTLLLILMAVPAMLRRRFSK